MYEDGTAITQMRDEGEIDPVDEDTENEMYDYLCERLKNADFQHYEVSNFAIPGHEAKHNSNYWNETQYIGIGAGAHSYIGDVRSWNPDNLDDYIQGILNGTLHRESETLTEKDKYNERIMLGLRTNRGVLEPTSSQYRTNFERLIQKNLLKRTGNNRIVATQQGLHILNRIIEDLMI
jgi:oxygen-independent coproporphyrinogen-3 oxidase